MADWIKMRSGLLTNPKVIRMAKLLASNPNFVDWMTRGWSPSRDVTRDVSCDVTVVTRVTVGSLLAVWASVNDAASQDGFLKGIDLSDIDNMAGVPGFGVAMGAVGWAEEGDDGTYFPNFDEHNSVAKQRVGEGKSAKSGAERTREWRQRRAANGDGERDVTGDVTVTSQRDGREEKNREEKKETKASSRKGRATALPADFGISERVREWAAENHHDRLDQHLARFVGYAKANGKTYVDWDQAFMNAVRDNWAKLPVVNGNGQSNRFAGAK